MTEDMVFEVLTDSDLIRAGADEHDNTHYIKDVPQLGGDTVTVVVDPHKQPNRVVTVMRESKEVRL